MQSPERKRLQELIRKGVMIMMIEELPKRSQVKFLLLAILFGPAMSVIAPLLWIYGYRITKKTEEKVSHTKRSQVKLMLLMIFFGPVMFIVAPLLWIAGYRVAKETTEDCQNME